MSSELGARVARLRKQRGWSQRKLAVIADVSNATISRIESGATNDITITALSMIASALGCDLSQLLHGQPARQARLRELSAGVCRALVDLSAPGKVAKPHPGLNEEIAFLRRTRVACNFAQTIMLAPTLLRALSPIELPQQTAHVGYDVALSLRMLGMRSDAWLAIRIAQTAAEHARSPALLNTILALQAVFAIEDGELAAAHAIVNSVPKQSPASQHDACGSAALQLIEGLVHAHTRISDGSDQVRDATTLLSFGEGGGDLLGTGICRTADVRLWAMKIAVARRDMLRAQALAGPCPTEAFTATLWHLNMCAVQLHLGDAQHAAQTLLVARDLAPQLLPSRPETLACVDQLLGKPLRHDTKRRLRTLREAAVHLNSE